jgi:hypothetical protein
MDMAMGLGAREVVAEVGMQPAGLLRVSVGEVDSDAAAQRNLDRGARS